VDDLLLPHGWRSAFVMQGECLSGLITLSDIRHIPRDTWTQTPVGLAMTPLERLHTVAPRQSLNEVLPLMVGRDVNQPGSPPLGKGGICIILLMIVLRTSRLAVVGPPALWRRIDIAGNRRRHPANTEAEKDQEGGLRSLRAPDRQCEEENNHPNNGEAGAVDPIVSESKHFLTYSFRRSPVRGRTRTLESSRDAKS